jgi:hypothetical protein
MDNEIPLIWTSKGNVPLDSVKQEVVWDIQDSYIKVVERYRDVNGDIVKEGAHVYSRYGLTGEPAIATF